MTLDEHTDTSVKGHIYVKEAGRLILSIPSEDGWTLMVDGKKVLIEDFKDTFISVYLEEGEHTIALSYMTPGLETGEIISIFSIVVAVSALVLGGKRGKKVS